MAEDKVVAYRKADNEISDLLSCQSAAYGTIWRRLVVRNFNCAEEELSIYTVYGTPRACTPCTMAAGHGSLGDLAVWDADVLKTAKKYGWTPGLIQNVNIVNKIEEDEALATWMHEQSVAWDIQEHVQRINWAIDHLKHVEFSYGPGMRVVAPYEVGQTKDGRMLLRGYQTKGYSSRGKIRGWKLFGLDKVFEILVQCAPFEVRGDYYTLPPFWTKAVAVWVP